MLRPSEKGRGKAAGWLGEVWLMNIAVFMMNFLKHYIQSFVLCFVFMGVINGKQGAWQMLGIKGMAAAFVCAAVFMLVGAFRRYLNGLKNNMANTERK